VSADITLVVDGVSKHYGLRRSSRVVALDDVSVTVDSATSVGIVGESGSGKSTLARILVGLEHPSLGQVSFNGSNVHLMSPSELLDFRRTVQFVAQDTTSSFDPRRTLRDSVRLPAQKLGGLDKARADERVDETLHQLGLPLELADRKPTGVSGGQRQRFSLARAVVVRPRLLICDEVVSALDVSVQGSILNLLKAYCAEQGAGLVFVSHGLPATAFVSKRLVVMHRGRVVENNLTSRALSEPHHPYSAQLLAAYHGGPNSPEALPKLEVVGRSNWACRYAALCPRASAICESTRPELSDTVTGQVACHHPLGVSPAPRDQRRLEDAAHA
jgi:ABC-type oligopeptide transport system ATPase subunit